MTSFSNRVPTGVPGVREWIASLERVVAMAAAFDTRISSRLSYSQGRASKSIGRQLTRHGLTMVAPPESFLVDKKSHLLPGEVDRARAWASAFGDAGRPSGLTERLENPRPSIVSGHLAPTRLPCRSEIVAEERNRKGEMMFEHILIAVDGSEYDRKALGATKDLAKLAEASVRVVHVRQSDVLEEREEASHLLDGSRD
jgi:hypothetical protein